MPPGDVHVEPTLANLLPPYANYRYFAARGDRPLVAQSDDFQPTNAGWLIDASLLAYGEEAVRQALRDAGVPGAELHAEAFGGESTQCVTLVAAEFAIVAFRGTRAGSAPDPIQSLRDLLRRLEGDQPGPEGLIVPDLDDSLTDGNFPTEDEGIPAGFAAAFEQVREGLEGFLGGLGGKPVWFTGHSLGGALATVAAFRADAPTAQGLYTFGSPRVGNAKFVRAFQEKFAGPCFRFIHGADVVTELPPGELVLGYQPLGERKYLSSEGGLIEDAGEIDVALDRVKDVLTTALSGIEKGLKNLLADPQGIIPDVGTAQMEIPFAALADNAPIYYANILWNVIEGE